MKRLNSPDRLAQHLALLEAAMGLRLVKTLRPGATAAQLAKLARALERPVPPELREWFAWHDGQRADAEFDAENNMRLLSVSSAVSAYRFLNDPREDICAPCRDSWFPLGESPGGDYLVLDVDTGRVLVWRHDDPKRPNVAPSLEAYVEQTARSFRKRSATRRPPKPPTSSLEVPSPPPENHLQWKRVTQAPTRAQLGAQPVGTVYCINPNPENHALYARVAAKRWLYVGGRSIRSALRFWKVAAARQSVEGLFFATDAELAGKLGKRLRAGWRVLSAVASTRAG